MADIQGPVEAKAFQILVPLQHHVPVGRGAVPLEDRGEDGVLLNGVEQLAGEVGDDAGDLLPLQVGDVSVGAGQDHGQIVGGVGRLQLVQRADDFDLLPPHIVDIGEVAADGLQPWNQRDLPMEEGALEKGDQAVRQLLHREGQDEMGDLLQAVGRGDHPRGVEGGDVLLLQTVGGQNAVVQRPHALNQDGIAPADGGVLGTHRRFRGVLDLKVPVQQVGPGIGGARVIIQNIAAHFSFSL